MKTSHRAITVLSILLSLGFVPITRAQDTESPDPRLSKPVTLSLFAANLESVAGELTKQTGVTIRIGSGDKDWKSKERLVHVNLKKLSLGAALRQLTDTLGFDMRRSGDTDHWTYRIWQTQRNRDYETAMIAAQKEKADQEIADIRRTVFEDAESMGELTPRQVDEIRETDPWRAFLGGTQSGRAYAKILRGLPDEARELVLRGRKVRLDADTMTSDMRDALVRMSGTILEKLPASMGPVGDMFKGMKPSAIVFAPLTGELGSSAGAAGIAGLALVMGEIDSPTPVQSEIINSQSIISGMGKGFPMISLPLTGSDSTMANVIGRMMLRVESGENIVTAMQEMQGDIQRTQAQPAAMKKRIQPTPTPTDPALLVEIEPLVLSYSASGDLNLSEELLKQLSKKTDLSFIWEYYPNELPIAMALPSEKTPLHRLLDSLQLAGFTWGYKDRVIHVRPGDWAIKRSYDIPESVLAGYRALLKAKGFYSLEDLASVAVRLTDGQIQNRFLADRELRVLTLGLVSIGEGNRALLRLYGGMDPLQQARVKTEDGLPIDQLTEEQWTLLATVIEDAGEEVEITGGRIRLKMETRMPDDQPGTAGSGEANRKANPGTGSGGENRETRPEPADDDAVGPDTGSANAGSPGPAGIGNNGSTKEGDVAAVPETDPKTGDPAADRKANSKEPVSITARFLIDIVGDDPKQPVHIERPLMVPSKRLIEATRKEIESLTKKPSPGPKPLE